MNAQDVAAMFESPDPEQRREALAAIPALRAGDPLRLLLQGMADPDWRVRREAVESAVVVVDARSSIDRLVRALHDATDAGLRNAVIEVIGRVGGQAADALAAACEQATPSARKFFIEAMGRTGDSTMLPAIARWIEDEDDNACVAAMEGAVRIGGTESERILRSQLHRDDPYLRITLLECLTRSGAEVSWAELSPVVHSGPTLRVAAALLGRTGSVEAVEPLWHLVEETVGRSRTEGLCALHELALISREARKLIRERLELRSSSLTEAMHGELLSGDATTRKAVAFLSALCEDAHLVEPLLVAMSAGVVDEDVIPVLRGWQDRLIPELLSLQGGATSVWASSLYLLGELNPAETAEELAAHARLGLRRALGQPAKSLVAAAAGALSTWGTAEDIGPLRALLVDPAPAVHQAAGNALRDIAGRYPEALESQVTHRDLEGPAGFLIAESLSAIGSDRCCDLLYRGLQSQDAQTRRACVGAIHAARGSDGDPLIALAVLDEHVDVQGAAVQALKTSNTTTAKRALSSGLESDYANIRADAAIALGEQTVMESVEAIRQLLHDPEPLVVGSCIEALAMLEPETVGDAIQAGVRSRSHDVVQSSLRAAAIVNGADSVACIEQGLAHQAWHVRVLAASLLGTMNTTDSREALARAVESEQDDLVLQAISEGLGGIRL